MGQPGQTPGSWLHGGALALWSAACKRALVACGINPANFGTYDLRAKAQAAERKKYREQRKKEANQRGKNKRPHEGNCGVGKDPKALCMCIESDVAYFELGSEKWMLANSQSGHISQNALYQNERADPCSNVPPEGKHGGTYGYRDNKAFCMDHLGRANNPGTIHYEITNRESQFAASLERRKVKAVTEGVMMEGAKGTAEVAAMGAGGRQNGKGKYTKNDKDLGKMTPERIAEGKRSDEAKDHHAADLKANENASAEAGASGKGKGKKPNAPSAKKPTAKQVDKAVECISDAWKQSLDEMRNDVINEFSTAARSPECKKQIKEYKKTLPKDQRNKKIRYTDLPPERRAAVDASVNKKTGNPKMSAVERDQKKLEKKGAKTAGEANNPPTQKDCLQYQSNWLQQHRKADGSHTPMQGRVPSSDKADPAGDVEGGLSEV
ncbi:hypothetical protein [Myxococcus landrumensis]|uniref:Tox-PAAR-like domain-containing protein n=1 Tax=Myxococcus landrumensis TaxID=2813577 RepID=A0ABX7MZ52_9BACT|nr:hypothetical protein [Myxococcus landrumus]QSQ11628.1 hypothetical protein JY572_24910 [Myxococcus landrumus]